MPIVSLARTQGLSAARAAFARALDIIGGRSSWWPAFVLATSILLLRMAPIEWGQNEINYMNLALKSVAPERFPALSAIFDESEARFASFGLLGLLAKAFGLDGALVIGRLANIVAYAAALATLARAWRLSLVEITLGLVVFLVGSQNYFAGEWLFSGVEPKTLAYPAAIFAIAWASQGAGGRALSAAALATYFHFLVGGFWAMATLLLLAIRGTPLPRVARLGAIYAGTVLPLLLILIQERLLAPAPDLSGLDLSLNQIYGAFRNPHHVAPFASVGSFRSWIPGIAEMAAASLSLALAWTTHSASRPLAAWLLALHGYLAVCFVLAFLDRGTHVLAPFIIFRPNSLILLFALLFLVSWLHEVLPAAGERGLTALALGALIVYAPPPLAYIALHVAQAKQIPITPHLTAVPEAMIKWLRETTGPKAVVVVEPTAATNWQTPWIAFERRIDRPTLVHFKFVPTAPQDLARWYRLVRWREAVFVGACGRLEEQPIDYLVVVQHSTLERMARCGRVVWHRDGYGVIAVGKMPGNLS
jgi:hypothetical protein